MRKRMMRTKSRDKGGEGHGSSLALRTDRGTRGADKWSSIWGTTCHWGREEVMSDGSLLTWLISRHSALPCTLLQELRHLPVMSNDVER